jgi:molybdate transport system substrate-binding protein
MRAPMKHRMAIPGLMIGALLARTIAAGEVSVLSAGAVEPGVKAASAAFQKATGHTVTLAFDTAPQIRKRLAGGEKWNVVIAPSDAVEELIKAGIVESENVRVGRVGIAAAVRADAPIPDISTADALRRSILDAESVVFNRASSGLYFESLLRKIGIYGQVEGKITRYSDGASVMEHLLKGRGREVGFGPITEILLHRDKGLRLVGPLPGDLQNYVSYAAASMTTASDPQIARAFVRYLGSPAGRALFVDAGID